MRAPAFRTPRALGPLVLVLLLAGTHRAAASTAAGDSAHTDWAALARLAPLERAERVVLVLEQAEVRGQIGGSRPPWTHGSGADDPAALAERIAVELDSLLALAPGDVRANLLYARLGRVLIVTRPMKIALGEGPPPPGKAVGRCLEALDRALANEPENAELHNWKARVYGMMVPRQTENDFHDEIVDMSRALASARRAVDLAPGNEDYREALALYLFSGSRLEEAADVMREAREGHHPLSRLLEDWKAIPLPPGATLVEDDPGNQREMVVARGFDYPMVRVRCYAVFAKAAAVEKFYRHALPGFRLFSEGRPEAGMAMFTQFLKWRAQDLEPVRSGKQVWEAMESAGVMVLVTEFRGAEALKLSRISEPVGDVVCWLYLSNLRPSEGR